MPAYYAVIPAKVRYDNNIPSNAKFLYGEITSLCNEKGYCWASNKYLAESLGKYERQVQWWVSRLIEYGYIIRIMVYKKGTKEVLQRRLYLSDAPDIPEGDLYVESLADANPLVTKLAPPPGDEIGTRGGDVNVTHTNTKSTNTKSSLLEPSVPSGSKKNQKPSLISEDWQISPELMKKVKERFPFWKTKDILTRREVFINIWLSRPNDNRRTDWDRTFMNHCIAYVERQEKENPGFRGTSNQTAAGVITNTCTLCNYEKKKEPEGRCKIHNNPSQYCKECSKDPNKKCDKHINYDPTKHCVACIRVNREQPGSTCKLHIGLG